MKHGHIRGAGGRNNLHIALVDLSSNSLETKAVTPLQLAEQIEREDVKPEIVWARSRYNLNIS